MHDPLAEIRRTEPGRYHRRLHAVLLARSLPLREVALLLGVSRRAVQYWARAFAASGPQALKVAARPGRPSGLGAALSVGLEALLAGAPAQAGLRCAAWTGAALRRHLKRRFGVRLSLRQCQRLVRSRGVSLAARRQALISYGAMT